MRTKNKSSFTTLRKAFIYDNGTVKSKFFGYYAALPLTEAVTKEVIEGYLTGINIDHRHLVAYNEKPYSIYIGGIAGNNELSKGYLMVHLKNKLIKAKQDGVAYALARGATEIGKKRLEEYGFIRIRNDDNIPLYKLDLQDRKYSDEELTNVQRFL